MKKYLVVVEGGRGSGSYSAYSPDIDGVVAAGESVEEVLELMYKALQWHIEDMVARGEPLPDESVTSVYIAVPDSTIATVETAGGFVA